MICVTDHSTRHGRFKPPSFESLWDSSDFTPTGSSWLDLVESWLSKLTQQRLRRGVSCSVQELVAAIKNYLTHHNADPKPFVWCTTVETMLGKDREVQSHS